MGGWVGRVGGREGKRMKGAREHVMMLEEKVSSPK
jgi:hypothetical protein